MREGVYLLNIFLYFLYMYGPATRDVMEGGKNALQP